MTAGHLNRENQLMPNRIIPAGFPATLFEPPDFGNPMWADFWSHHAFQTRAAISCGKLNRSEAASLAPIATVPAMTITTRNFA
jgi:hypothetical protein